MEELDAELVRDHLAEVEFELLEVVEQQHRAEAQGRDEAADELQGAINQLHDDLAQTADAVANQGSSENRQRV
jgi:hypothetical protein